ncbi:RES family NAD+ phosphorylase [Roseateles koreensis]|uniref:RES family NAD+ phosphorylase n=1 Tax=Roseateles koreensis TaxID=2987526 RepID=A0ABT5KNQ5_9BURK|nr:RES family NAD+ phosphorylase [Roseateles koreensis]MDC8784543.1 RES family NAD+ phosphorylase [Roseateles koreensis]
MIDLPQETVLPVGKVYRLVPSRYPPIGIFDAVANPDELAAQFALQSLTNPRIRDEVGDIQLVAPFDRVVGHGCSPVMAAFCHLNAEGSRFSDGTWGVYYAAASLQCAVAEVSHHRARFMERTAEKAIDLDMRSYVTTVAKPLHDVRGPTWATIKHPEDYRPSQALACVLRSQGSWGLAYESIRSPGEECYAALRPPALHVPVVQGAHVTLRWDGSSLTSWYHKSGDRPIAQHG